MTRREKDRTNPILAYWADIKERRVTVPQTIVKLYGGLVRDIETPRAPWMYDNDLAWHAIDFIQTYCKHSKGAAGGKPFILEMWQKAFCAALFGFVHEETRLRRFREALLEVGRKNGKSTFAAAIALYLMVADGEMGAEIYNAATKRDQAKIIWLEAKRMVRKSPALRKRLKTLVAEIVGIGEYDGCVMKPLGADSETLDGLNVHGAIMDETHAWPGMDLYNVIVDGESAREQPITLMTTTAGFVRGGLYDEKNQEAMNSLNEIDGMRDDTLLAALYRLDAIDEWKDPDCWQKANPGLGTIKRVDALALKVDKAKRNPRLLANLLCKEFDMPQISAEAWLTYDEIKNDLTYTPDELRDSVAIGGCDLSATTDLTCATLMVRRPDDPITYVLQQYFIPEKRVEELEDTPDGRPREAPYRTWSQNGLVTICHGNQVDYHAVTEWFARMRDEYGIRPLYIGFDRALAGYWLDDMDVHGFTWMGEKHPANVMEKVAQGAFTWTQPMKELGAQLAAKTVNYNRNPVTMWCLTNTVAKSRNEDGVKSIEPRKLRESQRIDGTVSMLNAWVCYLRHYDEYMQYVEMG